MGSAFRSAFTWELSSATSNEALELYRHNYDGLCTILNAAPSQPGRHFLNRVSTYDLGAGVLSQCSGTRQTLVRSSDDTRRVDPDMVIISLSPRGLRHADFNGRAVTVKDGDIKIAESGQPMTVFLEDDFQSLKLMIPRAQVPQSLLDFGLHGLTLGADTPIGHMIGQHLRALKQMAEQMSPAEAEVAIRAIFVMIGGGLDIGRTSRAEKAAVLQRSVRAQALDHINRALKDPELKPETVAKRLGVSRSTLYNAFKDDGGIWHQIRTRRLDAVFAALRNRRNSRPSIQQIAYDHGFVSDTHFSKAFSSRFGIRPGEVGDMPVLDGGVLNASDDMTNLARYVSVWKPN